MRPGCDRVAAARVAFDPVSLHLWLDPLSRNPAPVQELCEFHIGRLTVPRGWTATDRRPDRVALDAAGATVQLVGTASVAAPEPDAALEPDAAPDVEVASEPVPVALSETPDEEGELEEPSTPEAPAADRTSRRRRSPDGESSLLSRAFSLSGPQESVLTSGRKDERR